jgi:membrane protein required for colicin V production
VAAGISWVDWVLLAVLALSVVVGLVRGFIYEVLSLLGWVAAYFAAQWLAPQLAPALPVGTPGSALNHAAAFAIVFILALIVWGLAVRVLRMLVRATPLGGVDRLLGALFGAARGLVLLLAVASVVMLTPMRHEPAWQQSRGAAWLASGLDLVKPLLPASVARHLPA